jgi:hypothetical protein
MSDNHKLNKMTISLGILFSVANMQSFSSDLKPLNYQLDVEGQSFTFDSAVQNDCSFVDFLYPFPVIAKALGAEHKYDSEKQLLTVIRAPDKAVFTLSFEDGLVTVGGQTVGYVPNISKADVEHLLLNQPAIEVLTGTHFNCDTEEKSVSITLDKRLKPQFGFTMLVDGRPLAATEVLPRSIGSILLLPLKPIVDELDQKLSQPDANTIELYRTQDSVTFSLDLQSGIVKMNGTTIGITPNMAYARPDQLLLPSTAIETLTGTNVKILPGKNTIEINMDDRLKNRVLPGEYVLEQAANTPFVAESVDFFVGNQSLATLTLRSHFHEFNTRLRYEIPDFPRSGAELEPSWVSLEFDSLRGYSGSLGDYNSQHRELREVDVSRIRGLSVNTRVDDGWVIGVAGMPLVGSEQLDDETNSNTQSNFDSNSKSDNRSGFTSSFDKLQQSRPTFEGFAAGIRFIHKSREWEAGISGRSSLNGDSPRIVGNVYRRWLHSKGFLENASTSIDVDLGVFSNGNDGPMDTRIRFNHSLTPTSFLGINMSSDYTGVNFDSKTQSNDDLNKINDLNELGNINNASDHANTSLSFNFSLPHDIGLSVFGNWGQTGLRTDYVGNTISYGANLSARPFRAGPWTSISYARSYSKTADEDFILTDEVASLWANQQFDWFRYSARLEYDLLNKHKLASLNLSHKPLEYKFPKQAVVSANVVATGIWNDQSGISANLGGRIHADSGTLLGNNWSVGADFTRFQPLPSLLAEDTETEAQASNFISVHSKYRISSNFELRTIYSNDFGDDHTFRLSLRGHIGINPPRRYKKALEGKGILKGRLFLDKNGDGLFQADEKPLAGVILKLEGTRLALRTDLDGYYTIANLPTGSFRVNVDETQLPLGLIRESAYIRYATVGAGQITEYDIPMIKSGQIRGRIFIDDNDNGKLDKGEQGLEGVTIMLIPGDLQTVSSAFGQYAFDELSPGGYQFKVVDDDLVAQWSMRVAVDTDQVIVDTEDKWLQKIDIPVKKKE